MDYSAFVFKYLSITVTICFLYLLFTGVLWRDYSTSFVDEIKSCDYFGNTLVSELPVRCLSYYAVLKL